MTGPLYAGASLLFLGAGFTGLYGTFIPQAGVWCRNISHGARSGGKIALTFDDGPSPGASDLVLEILEKHRVPAAFFVIGRNARDNPNILREMDRCGHVIGNHTFDHHHLSVFRGRAYWWEQLHRTDELVAELIGRRPAFFRPPVGIKFVPAALASRRLKTTMITWSRRGLDGVATSPQRVIQRLSGRTRSGDILALHDGLDPHYPRKPETTLRALPGLIQRLRDQGLSFVRLDELIGISAYR